jgi:hypothetical protein
VRSSAASGTLEAHGAHRAAEHFAGAPTGVLLVLGESFADGGHVGEQPLEPVAPRGDVLLDDFEAHLLRPDGQDKASSERYDQRDRSAFLAEMHHDVETIPLPEWPEPGPYVGEDGGTSTWHSRMLGVRRPHRDRKSFWIWATSWSPASSEPHAAGRALSASATASTASSPFGTGRSPACSGFRGEKRPSQPRDHRSRRSHRIVFASRA